MVQIIKFGAVMIIETIEFLQLNCWAVQYLLAVHESTSLKYPFVPLGQLVHRRRDVVFVEDDKRYKQVTLRTNFMGAQVRTIKKGCNIRTRKQFKITEGQLLVSKIDARNGAFALVPYELSGAIITSNFWVYDVDDKRINPSFLLALLSTRRFLNFAEKVSNGSTGRHYLQENNFLDYNIPLPSLHEQDDILDKYETFIVEQRRLEKNNFLLEQRVWKHIQKNLGIANLYNVCHMDNRDDLEVLPFSSMQNWDVNVMNYFQVFNSSLYPTFTLSEKISNIILLQRGQRPRYSSPSTTRMINQKCIRRGYVDMKYSKEIDSEWASGVDGNLKTRDGDILICSTGNGTLGRAALVNSSTSGLLYDSHVILLRIDNKQLSPVLLCYLINSEYGQKQIEKLKTARTTNQTELGISNLLKVRFPFPKINMQRRLANYIRKREVREIGENARVISVFDAAKLLDSLIYV